MENFKSRFNVPRGTNDRNVVSGAGPGTVAVVPQVVDLTTTDAPLPAAPAPVPVPATTVTTSSGRDNQILNWCFTLYPESIGSDDLVMDVINRIGEDSKWAIFGAETCPTTKRLHFQCYAIFKKRARLSELAKRYHRSIHWEIARGSPSQNWDYCSKEDKHPIEFGIRPEFDNNGEREKNRWDEARKNLTSGRIEEVDSQIYIAHYRSCKAIINDNVKVDRLLDTYPGLWLYGTPGSGKSWEARMMQTSKPYVKKADKWWCNYNFEPIVVIEDFSPDHAWMVNLLKCWTDVYPFPAEVKQGNLPMIRPEKIIITSNYSMAECFAGVDSRSIDIKALMRRFKRKFFPFKYDGSGVAKSFEVTDEDVAEIAKATGTVEAFNQVQANAQTVTAPVERPPTPTPAVTPQQDNGKKKRARFVVGGNSMARRGETMRKLGLPLRRSVSHQFGKELPEDEESEDEDDDDSNHTQE